MESEFEKPRIARLTAIMMQLQSASFITARQIADKHQVSIRTVYRDIKTLNQSGVPIETIEGKGYTLMQGYSLPPVTFSEEEANALVTAEKLIALNNDSSLIESYSQAILKIKGVMRSTDKVKTELLSTRMAIRKPDRTLKESELLAKLQKAITNFQVVHFEYTAMNQAVTQRSVEPFALVSTRGYWLLIAFCQLRNEFRAFKLAYMANFMFLSAHFEPHKLTLEDYFKEFINPQHTPDTPLTVYSSSFVPNQEKKNKMDVKKTTVVGISVRTINRENQAMIDISALWQRFMQEGVMNKIDNKVNNHIWAIYHNYEGDHLAPYSCTLGCEVSSMSKLPAEFDAVEIHPGEY
ncbi:MAG: WYL domain-containing protein, partial [Flavobacteriales bacterium]